MWSIERIPFSQGNRNRHQMVDKIFVQATLHTRTILHKSSAMGGAKFKSNRESSGQLVMTLT